MVVAAAGAFGPCPRVAVRLRVLRRVEHALKHGMAVRVHVGADDVPARLHCLIGESIAPGAVAAVELEGREPFLVAPGDRFVLRAENATETLGGGVVVERLEQRLPRRREGIAASILARAERLDDPSVLVGACLAAAGERGADLAALALGNALRVEALGPIADGLVAAGTVVRAGRGRLFARDGYQALRKRVVDAVIGCTRRNQACRSCRSRGPHRGRPLRRHALERCSRTRPHGRPPPQPEGAVAWKGHAAEMPAADRERADRVSRLLREGDAAREGELCGILGWPRR
jgi:selenocysteine-specific elongation factor